MLHYLRHLLKTSDGFTVSIYVGDTEQPAFKDVGIFEVDDLGVVIEGDEVNRRYAMPWTAIHHIEVTVS